MPAGLLCELLLVKFFLGGFGYLQPTFQPVKLVVHYL